MQLIKQGWDEIPETMFSGALAGIGLWQRFIGFILSIYIFQCLL